MFDKLIESNSAEAEFKPRRKFFMVSSVVVGIMFLSALMISLYAQKLDLGTESFELSAIMAPVPDTPEPEPPREQNQQQQHTNSPATEATRQNLIARMDQSFAVPDAISTTPSKFKEMPLGRFRLSSGPETNGTGSDRAVGETGSSSATPEPTETEVERTPPPPIAPKPAAPKAPISIGVANGKATYLPKPPYPSTAIAVGAKGDVTVQVTIDEEGKVISAKAVNGHPLLRGVSEKAAWGARFSPTTLSKVPVKVTGVIVYKFSR
jgi:TonB family protein